MARWLPSVTKAAGYALAGDVVPAYDEWRNRPPDLRRLVRDVAKSFESPGTSPYHEYRAVSAADREAAEERLCEILALTPDNEIYAATLSRTLSDLVRQRRDAAVDSSDPLWDYALALTDPIEDKIRQWIVSGTPGQQASTTILADIHGAAEDLSDTARRVERGVEVIKDKIDAQEPGAPTLRPGQSAAQSQDGARPEIWNCVITGLDGTGRTLLARSMVLRGNTWKISGQKGTDLSTAGATLFPGSATDPERPNRARSHRRNRTRDYKICHLVFPYNVFQLFDPQNIDYPAAVHRWEQVFQLVCLTQVDAHKNLLVSDKASSLEYLKMTLPGTLFGLPGCQSPFQVANALASEDRFFERYGSWDHIENFLTSLEQGEVKEILLLIDDIGGNYTETNPRLTMFATAALADFLLTQDSRYKFVRTAIVVRSGIHDYLLKEGRRYPNQLGFIERSLSKDDLKSIYDVEVETRANGTTAFGAESIWVDERGAHEDLHEYILRHTFLTADEVRQVATGVGDLCSQRGRSLSEEEIRNVVNSYTRTFASSRVRQASTELAALIGDDVRLDSGASRPTLAELRSFLDQTIERCRSEVIEFAVFKEMVAARLPGAFDDVLATLWRQRLILRSAEDGSPSAKCSRNFYDQFRTYQAEPLQVRFHPALTDYYRFPVWKKGERIIIDYM